MHFDLSSQLPRALQNLLARDAAEPAEFPRRQFLKLGVAGGFGANHRWRSGTGSAARSIRENASPAAIGPPSSTR